LQESCNSASLTRAHCVVAAIALPVSDTEQSNPMEAGGQRMVTTRRMTLRPKYKRATLDAAAKLIQSRYRAKHQQDAAGAPQVIYKQVYPASTYLAAAVLLQAMYRGKKGRRRAEDRVDEMEVEAYQAKKRDDAAKKRMSEVKIKQVHGASYYEGAAKLIQGIRRRSQEETAARPSSAKPSFRLSRASATAPKEASLPEGGEAAVVEEATGGESTIAEEPAT